MVLFISSCQQLANSGWEGEEDEERETACGCSWLMVGSKVHGQCCWRARAALSNRMQSKCWKNFPSIRFDWHLANHSTRSFININNLSHFQMIDPFPRTPDASYVSHSSITLVRVIIQWLVNICYGRHQWTVAFISWFSLLLILSLEIICLSVSWITSERHSVTDKLKLFRNYTLDVHVQLMSSMQLMHTRTHATRHSILSAADTADSGAPARPIHFQCNCVNHRFDLAHLIREIPFRLPFSMAMMMFNGSQETPES